MSKKICLVKIIYVIIEVKRGLKGVCKKGSLFTELLSREGYEEILYGYGKSCMWEGFSI